MLVTVIQYSGILGQYQTYIGVLASILLLCIFLDRSNLPEGLLKKTRSNVKATVEKLQKKIISIKKRKFKSKDYEEWVNSLPNKDRKRLINARKLKKQSTEITELDIVSLHVGLDKQVTETDLIIPKANRMIEHVHKLDLRFSAPLYSLLCCLILFIFDNVCILSPKTQGYLSVVMEISLVLSSAFWIILWFRAIKDLPNHFHKSTHRTARKTHPSKRKQTLFNLWLDRDIMYTPHQTPKLFMIVDLYSIFLILGYFGAWCSSILTDSTSFQEAIFFTIACIPVVWSAIDMMRITNTTYSYGYSHCFKHLVGFLIVGLFTALMLIEIKPCEYSYYIASRNNLVFWWSVFILLNGLILPFIIGYLGYHGVIQWANNDADESLNGFFKKLYQTECDSSQNPNRE